jgi:hypothetical protein
MQLYDNRKKSKNKTQTNSEKTKTFFSEITFALAVDILW